ncbi:HD-GYP domain-containing protein [Sideroxydans lithotrophicus]|uniref:Metal dependent phosphohydrolase n=1 Tax=Sideroxydans lithotrophicus (strain ES-1) TaxID=580332 RepID=D5CPW3_SIDLE|nr:HD domain-containing phosphohydrolase [Sideroxydans lithotrophicus]ADE11127.1 metal dependent phosphohydrolase [Sideroxydans lithotrophicus ES-1]
MENRDDALHTLSTYTKVLSVALGYRDMLTQLHSERVQDISLAIGKARGLSKVQLKALQVAASFHDIGKIGIPDRILLKPAQFDDAEWKVMQSHSEIGERIMAATELEGSQLAADVIRHHHEHFDGTGYPDGLAGEDIPICARIISIADSYDAMAVTRSYHRSRAHPDIMGILQQENGKKHDPELMDIFCGLIESSEFKAARN